MEFRLPPLMLLMLMISTGTIVAFELSCADKQCVIENMYINIFAPTTINFTNLNWDYANATGLTLKNSRMLAIPRSIITNMNHLEKFNAEDCHILLISVFAASNQEYLARLKHLNLKQNQIVRLRTATFAGAKELVTLHLSQNSIETVERSAFAGLDKLEELYLDRNNMKTLDWSTIAEATSLLTLDLTFGELNSIDAINEQPKKLSLLKIGHNKLKDMSGIEKLISLKELILSGNENLKLNLTLALAGMSELEVLHLGRTPAIEINFYKFPVLPKLTFMWLDQNHLEKIDGYTVARQKFPKLSTIDIGYNKFACGYLETMSKKLKALGIEVMAKFQHQATTEKTVDGIICTDGQSPPSNDQYDEYVDPMGERDDNVKASLREMEQRIQTLEASISAGRPSNLTESAVPMTTYVLDQDRILSSLHSQAVILGCFATLMTLVLVAAAVFLVARRRSGWQREGSVRMLLSNE